MQETLKFLSVLHLKLTEVSENKKIENQKKKNKFPNRTGRNNGGDFHPVEQKAYLLCILNTGYFYHNCFLWLTRQKQLVFCRPGGTPGNT